MVEGGKSVDLTTLSDESRCVGESLSYRSGDLRRSDAIDKLSILGVLNLTVSADVLDGFLKTIGLTLKSGEDGILKSTLSAVEVISGDGSRESLELRNAVVQQILSLISGTSYAKTEKTRVHEVEVKSFSGINVRMLSEDALFESDVVEIGSRNVESDKLSGSPRDGLEEQSNGESAVFGEVSDFTTNIL